MKGLFLREPECVSAYILSIEFLIGQAKSHLVLFIDKVAMKQVIRT